MNESFNAGQDFAAMSEHALSARESGRLKAYLTAENLDRVLGLCDGHVGCVLSATWKRECRGRSNRN